MPLDTAWRFARRTRDYIRLYESNVVREDNIKLTYDDIEKIKKTYSQHRSIGRNFCKYTEEEERVLVGNCLSWIVDKVVKKNYVATTIIAEEALHQPITIARQSSQCQYCLRSFSCTSSRNRHERIACPKSPDAMEEDQTTVNSIDKISPEMAVEGEDLSNNLTFQVPKTTCRFCSSSFSQVSSLNLHMRRSCKLNPDSAFSKASSAALASQSQCKDCKYCLKSFETVSAMKIHIETDCPSNPDSDYNLKNVETLSESGNIPIHELNSNFSNEMEDGHEDLALVQENDNVEEDEEDEEDCVFPPRNFSMYKCFGIPDDDPLSIGDIVVFQTLLGAGRYDRFPPAEGRDPAVVVQIVNNTRRITVVIKFADNFEVTVPPSMLYRCML